MSDKLIFEIKKNKIAKAIGLLLVFIILLQIPKIVHGFNKSENDGILVKFSSDKNTQEIAQNYDIDQSQIEKIDEFDVYKVKKMSWYSKIKLNWDKSIKDQIEYIEDDVKFNSLLVPNDTYYSEQWALPKISAPGAWESTQGDPTIIIAVIDTGINGRHEDLNGKIIEGHDYVNNVDIPANSDSDDNMHGTAVAGAISALTNNGKGISGLVWNSQLLPIKALDNEGSGYASDIALAIKYAADHGARVLNLSFGGERSSSLMNEAIDYAYNKGCFIVAAAGNDNSDVDEPARNPKVFAVGATTENDERWYRSSYGPELDAVAPGDSVLTTIDEIPGSNYAYVTGTSIAAPYVSGLAALLLANNPQFTNAEIDSFIKKNADKVSGMFGNNFSNYYGYGRINVYKTLNDYSSQWISQNSYPSIIEGKGNNFIVNLKNIGSVGWKKNIVHLGTSHPRDRITEFRRYDNENPSNSGWISNNRVEMQEDVIKPGETATFNFWMSPSPGMPYQTFREYFQPVADGITWMNDQGIYWDVTVLPAYRSEWVSQNAYPILGNGDSYQFELKLKNIGNEDWRKDIVHLGTSRPEDRIPIFSRDATWFSDNRVEMQDDTVAPGSTATFKFNYKVPNNLPNGIYREYFRPVADGITWINDQGIYWDVNVIDSSLSYECSWQSQSPYPVVNKGDTFEMYVKFINSGSSTWRKGAVNLGTSRPSDRIPIFIRGKGWLKENRIELMESEVPPGSIGTFRFEYTVPNDLSSGVYREYFRPVADGIRWLYDWGVYFDITVN